MNVVIDVLFHFCTNSLPIILKDTEIPVNHILDGFLTLFIVSLYGLIAHLFQFPDGNIHLANDEVWLIAVRLQSGTTVVILTIGKPTHQHKE